MKTQRKGTNDAIALRLQMSLKSNEQLLAICERRDPVHPSSRYLHSKKERDAARAVLVVRKVVVSADVIYEMPVYDDLSGEWCVLNLSTLFVYAHRYATRQLAWEAIKAGTWRVGREVVRVSDIDVRAGLQAIREGR